MYDWSRGTEMFIKFSLAKSIPLWNCEIFSKRKKIHFQGLHFGLCYVENGSVLFECWYISDRIEIRTFNAYNGLTINVPLVAIFIVFYIGNEMIDKSYKQFVRIIKSSSK